MKSITLSFDLPQVVTFEIDKLPKKWQTYLDAVFTDEEDRTDKQWNLTEKYTFYDMLNALGYNVDMWSDVDVESINY